MDPLKLNLKPQKIPLTFRLAATLAYRNLYGYGPTNYNNMQKAKKPGCFLETLALGALVVASRSGGLRGTPLSSFLPALVRELSLNFSPIPLLDIPDDLNLFFEFKIPFMPVIGTSVSEELQAFPGATTGFVKYCLDSQEIDGEGFPDCLSPGSLSAYSQHSSTIFTIEAKLHADNVDFSLISETISKSIEHKNSYMDKQYIEPGIQKMPRLHCHIIFVSSLSGFKDASLKSLDDKFPKVSVISVFRRSVNRRDPATSLGLKIIQLAPTDFDLNLNNHEFAEIKEKICPTLVIIIPIEEIYPEEPKIGYYKVESDESRPAKKVKIEDSVQKASD